MGKLYPPYIDSNLPAQTGKGFRLEIPFRLNYGVGKDEVYKIVALIKTVSTNTEIAILNSDNIDYENNLVYFDCSGLQFNIGQFYKLQLACRSYEENNPIGYYSTVGIFKWTAEPTLSLIASSDLNVIEGYYNQENGDITEKVYEYEFIIKQDDTMLLSTGKQIHNSINDTQEQSIDKWILPIELNYDINYQIIYKIYTINNLIREINISQSKIKSEEEEEILNQDALSSFNNYENGYIELILKPNIYGTFKIIRQIQNENYQYEIDTYSIPWSGINKSHTILKDFTIEQGIKYKYSVYRINPTTKVRTSNIIQTESQADFEDIFLFDGKQQLKIKFNPKVTSFKTVLQEQKIETLGSKFPFFFRNGNIYYNTFTINGLISYLLDNDELFMTKNDLGFFGSESNRSETKSQQTDFNFTLDSTQLTSNNILFERRFKLKVLEWLNNEDIKLFKSPTEGNYLVRLNNTSLTPNDTLGRMLHTFSTTAYEVADYNVDNLKAYHLL